MADTDSDFVLDHSWREPHGFLPRIVRPIHRLIRSSTGGALLMLAGAVLAIVWVNSPPGATTTPKGFGRRARDLADAPDAAWDDAVLTAREYDEVHQAMSEMRRLAMESRSPLDRLEAALANWAALVIVPLFALANSGNCGVAQHPDGVDRELRLAGHCPRPGGRQDRRGAGQRMARRTAGHRPEAQGHHLGADARGLCGAGVGFTVAPFVSGLAFTDPALTEAARLGVFAGSVIAGLIGFAILRIAPGAADRDASGRDDVELENL